MLLTRILSFPLAGGARTERRPSGGSSLRRKDFASLRRESAQLNKYLSSPMGRSGAGTSVNSAAELHGNHLRGSWIRFPLRIRGASSPSREESSRLWGLPTCEWIEAMCLVSTHRPTVIGKRRPLRRSVERRRRLCCSPVTVFSSLLQRPRRSLSAPRYPRSITASLGGVSSQTAWFVVETGPSTSA